MFNKVLIKFVCFIFVSVIIIVGVNIFYFNLYDFPNNVYVSLSDINDINEKGIYGNLIKLNLDEVETLNDDKYCGVLNFKLFGIFPIKKIKAEISKGANVYVGGIPLGFVVNPCGVMVVGKNGNSFFEDNKNFLNKNQIENGDVILKINNKEIKKIDDVINEINSINENSCEIVLLRNGNILNLNLPIYFDEISNNKKIGIWVKDSTNGVGTLTFVKVEDNRFGALGHPITDSDTNIEVPVGSGDIYKCSLVGLSKAEKNVPGELKCVFLQGVNSKGKIDKNSKYGVYGSLLNSDEIVDTNWVKEIGSRLLVKPGKAYVVSSVSGVRENYEIDIIKASYQPESDDKSFVFRVTDKRLLNLTGGILQGMSGSPIIQNNKLVGAVTHVFVSDPTKGYGIYSDWMINE